MEHLSGIVNNIKGLRILVAGDIMLDRFVYGDVDRISPEGPVPVLTVTREEEMLGGAGNVITNLCAIGASPVLLSVTGDDETGTLLANIAKDLGADVSSVLKDGTRPTIVKTRYLARNQQLLRSDRETIHALSPEIETLFLGNVERVLKTGVHAVVLSDYGKGVLTPRVIKECISMAKANYVTVLVDPKGRDYTRYNGADIVTPNRKELAEAAGRDKISLDADIIGAARAVMEACNIGAVLATRSEDGVTIVPRAGDAAHYKAKVREVFDVSGAGDTVIAVAAAAIAAGAGLNDAAALANIAGSIAVSKVGTSPVTSDELLAALGSGSGTKTRKFCTRDEALAQIGAWKKAGLKTGFTNGCFDILHKGHVAYMEDAKERCDRLILGLNSDASVRILKGPSRPVNDEGARAAVMAGLASIDMVVLFGASQAGEDNTPCALIEYLKPDIFFKGGDYTIETLPEAKIVAAYGGEVALMPFHVGYSTTSIIERSKKS